MEILETFINIIKNSWASKYIYWIIGGIFLCAVTPVICTEDEWKIRIWIQLAVILLICLGATIIVASIRRNYRFKENEYGIVLAINTEDEKHLKLIEEKFSAQLESRILIPNMKCKVVTLSAFHTEKLKDLLENEKKRNTFFRDTNTMFVISGRSVRGGNEESISCKLYIEGIAINVRVNENRKKRLNFELRQVLVPLNNIEISRTTETNDFEDVALKLNFAIDYIISIIYHEDMKYRDAESIITKLRAELNMYKKQFSEIAFLKPTIDKMLYTTCLCITGELMDSFMRDKERTYIVEAAQYLEKAGFLLRGAEYYNTASIYEFLANRDVKKALSYVQKEEALNKNSNQAKINKVFLKTYQKVTATNIVDACKTYYKHFEKNKKIYLPEVLYIIDFINNVLNEEPDKIQMNFLLFLISYYYYKDQIVAKQYYDIFATEFASVLEDEKVVAAFEKYKIAIRIV